MIRQIKLTFPFKWRGIWFQNALLRIPQSPQPPQYVFWQKNERMINYDDSRRDITIETSPGPRTQSRLIIREPQIADSGNYTCSASNTEPASIYVFVSKGNEGRLIHTASSSGLYPSTSALMTCDPPNSLFSSLLTPSNQFTCQLLFPMSDLW